MSTLPLDTEESEEAWLARYDPSAFPPVGVTVDLVILTIRDGQLSVLLIERAEHPARGQWALPGGFLDENDAGLDDAAARELYEETNLRAVLGEADGADPRIHLEQLGSYGQVGRDPRMRIVSVAYLAFAPQLPEPVAGSDASRARWWAVADLDLGGLCEGAGEGEGTELAFDHARILADGVERARGKLEYTALGTAFCAEVFTVSELRRVYEAVWATELDPRNFHRKVTTTPGFLVEAGSQASSGPGGGRPAALYRRGPARLLHPAMLRPGLALVADEPAPALESGADGETEQGPEAAAEAGVLVSAR